VKLAILDKYFIVLFQILNLERRKVACSIIRSNIDAMRAAEDDTLMCEGDDDDDDASSKSTFGGIYLGAGRKPCSFDDVAQVYDGKDAFTQFQAQFIKRLVKLFKQTDSPVTLKNASVLVQGSDKVSLIHFQVSCLKLNEPHY